MRLDFFFHVCCQSGYSPLRTIHLNLLSYFPLVTICNSTSSGAYMIYQLDILHMSSPIYICLFTYLLIVQF